MKSIQSWRKIQIIETNLSNKNNNVINNNYIYSNNNFSEKDKNNSIKFEYILIQ